MNRRGFLKTAGGFALGSILGGPLEAKTVGKTYKERTKNIIVILVDDTGAADYGCYGNEKYKTPNIDALAAGGYLFRTCYGAPICSPARAEIMTGKYAYRTKWFHNAMRYFGSEPMGHLGDNHILFSDALKRYGYATAVVGKWQLDSNYPSLGYDFGFDEYCLHHQWIHTLPKEFKYEGYVADEKSLFPGQLPGYWYPCIMQNGEMLETGPKDFGPDIFTDYLLDFAERKKDKRFFAYYPMHLAHVETDYEGDGKYSHVPVPELDKHGRRTGKRTPHGLKYHVEYVDHLVGRIVDGLDKLGLREDTVIMFCADNGSEGKATATELGVRVPMIVNCPGTVKSGVVSDELVDLSDVLPTMLDFAEGNLPGGYEIDGKSFASLVKGQKNAQARDWICAYYASQRILRDKRWLREGDGTIYDCGTSRDGTGYKDVTESNEPEVLRAKAKFARLLEKLPPCKDPFLINRYEEIWEKKFKENYKRYQKAQEEK